MALVRVLPALFVVVVGLSLLAVVVLGWWNRSHSDRTATQRDEVSSSKGNADEPSAKERERPAAHDEKVDPRDTNTNAANSLDQASAAHDNNATANPTTSPDEPGSFLEDFTAPAQGESASTAAPSDEALEQSFRDMLASMQQRDDLQARLPAAIIANDEAQLRQLRAEGQALGDRLNKQLGEFQGQLRQARQNRPDDSVVQWLTAELLLHVGGEPVDVLAYLQRAVDGGLERPRLFASLARVQFEANQFAASYDSALKALDSPQPTQYAWESYERVARGNERFDELLARLDAAFPELPKRPNWVAKMRERAERFATLSRRESSLRQEDQAKDDLPRVRLTIEHRRFAHDADGNSTSQIESTGRGEVELELFEDQAPQTVANFVSLCEQGFYDGTLFPEAASARYVRGGDPNTRNDDPNDDGVGGPGYVIADEYERPDARNHFRGSLSMVNTGPQTAGSQFFITLAPNDSFNGHFTVFGRVIQGEEVVDAITPGRTTTNIGHFGKLVPGDVLVKAEVIRKRPHEYVVTKK